MGVTYDTAWLGRTVLRGATALQYNSIGACLQSVYNARNAPKMIDWETRGIRLEEAIDAISRRRHGCLPIAQEADPPQ